MNITSKKGIAAQHASQTSDALPPTSHHSHQTQQCCSEPNSLGDPNTMDNTIISTDLYNREFVEDPSCAVHESQCCQLGESKKQKCVYLNLCLDNELFSWIEKQGGNYHATISQLLQQSMLQTNT